MTIDKIKNEIKELLLKKLKLDEVIVKSNGNYFQVIVVGKIFHGMTAVKKQQIIYKPLTKYITDKKIHALSIKVYTPIEWSKFIN
ncbi:BolA family protein [Arsenophonus symbiont of Ornithomya chloropus]|uniref:BolA family protein n=1 Tax=Arsenophonus symbiont of Ornithomya chloropus TaxID=634121 RepID=UPI0032B23224